MTYLGKIGEKITAEVTLVNETSFMNYSYSYYGREVTVYIMKDADENILVWKTTSVMSIQTGKDEWYYPKKNDKITVTGTVKAHSEYRGEQQTVLNRCKVSLIERAITYEEIKRMKQSEQRATLQEGDFIWTMPYKQYKEHYADCEKLYGSYCDAEENTEHRGVPTISVIIRNGRLKASGVRGEHYRGYQMQNELGQKITYRAVKEENALKRVRKDFPEHTWECVKIFNYQ